MDVEARADPRGLAYYWVSFRRGERDQGPDSDIEALNNGRITITALRPHRRRGLRDLAALFAAL